MLRQTLEKKENMAVQRMFAIYQSELYYNTSAFVCIDVALDAVDIRYKFESLKKLELQSNLN